MKRYVCALAIALAACAPAEPPAKVDAPESVQDIAAHDVPAEVAAVVQSALPGFRVEAAERKERDGRVYYDVEGVRPDGAEAELDLLQTADGWRVVEIQRDIAWAEAPAAVRDAVATAPAGFLPVRVIESAQTEDGAVIYELFAEGRPEAPSMEVGLVDGRARILTEANPH
jgi:hypothetical protein